MMQIADVHPKAHAKYTLSIALITFFTLQVPTPNRAELRAVILALSLVPLEPQVTISSHSTYILSNIADLQVRPR